MKRKLTKDRKRSKELDGLIRKLYEAYAGKKISEKRFEVLSGEYEREQEALEAAIAQEQAELDAFEADTARVRRANNTICQDERDATKEG